MKRKIIAGGMILVMAGVLLAGCGVPQEDLDAAEAAAAAAEAQVDALEADLAAAEADLSAAEAEAASLEADVATAEAAVTAAEAETASVQADLDDAESDLRTANSAKSAAQSALATAEADLATAEATIADLEAAAAAAEEPAEEPAADDDAAPAAGGTAPTTFDYLTYTDDTYGFTIAYEATWEAGEDYGAYVRLGAPPWSVPALYINYVGYENTDSGEITAEITDHEATIMGSAGPIFGSMTSINTGTLANGTEVTIYVYETLGDYPGSQASMYVEIDGLGFTFDIATQPALAWAVDDFEASAIESLLSLDF